MVISGREFYANLLVIDSGRMDWLSTFYAVIDCRSRKTIFQILFHSKLKFLGGNKSLGPVGLKVTQRGGILIAIDIDEG